MLKNLLTVVLPLMLPTLIYMAYAMFGRRGTASGNAVPPWWTGAPWMWLATGGVLLVAMVLVTLALTGGYDTSGAYHPARMIDGRVVGGETTPPAAVPAQPAVQRP